MLWGLLKLMRPHQWVKNFFVFAPLFFSFQFDITSVLSVAGVFVLFSSLASAVYILNDFIDIKEDQQHPVKKNRPLASGALPASVALIAAAVLAVTGAGVGFYWDAGLGAVLASYAVLNVLYSVKLKHVAVVDVHVIAIGFVLRLFAGASVISAELSAWIVVMTFLLALFLAVAKRRDDILLAEKGARARKNIDGYNLEFVNAAMVLMAGIVIVVYFIYTLSDSVISRFGSEYVYLTGFLVVLGVLRYMQITFVENRSGSPTQVVLKDLFIQLTVLGWLLSFVAIKLGWGFAV